VRHDNAGRQADADNLWRHRRIERELIRERCEEGIERAKARGTKFGRKAKLDASQKLKIAERHAKGETLADLAIDYEVPEPTIWRALQ
jgi:DNA invertase Pin-like site-specific DNA recombinase